MNIKNHNGFEQIKISDRLDEVVANAINKAKKDRQRKSIKSNLIKFSTGVASVFIIFTIGVNCKPVFAQSVKDVPILSIIAKAVQINYNKNIGNSISEGFADNTQMTKMAGDIKVSITNILSDNKNLYILYTLDGSGDKQGFKNVLLNNLQIKDSKGNILLDTKGGKDISQILTNIAVGKQGDTLVPINSYGYSSVVSSLGRSLQTYSEKQETSGIIQLSAENGKTIPDDIKLTFLGFTEAYNTSYAKQSYEEFISKFNRKPISIDADCSFDIKIDKKLSSISPETYNNIKFSANNTDFEVKYLNIYPTYIETKIQLGKNKTNNAQCVSIINMIGLDRSTLPYLIDENGNKYMPNRTHVALDADNSQTITFESSYFNKNNELYLVVNQLSYTNGIFKITPVKVRIK